MKEFELYFKVFVGLVGSFVSWLVDGLGLALVVLLCLMAVDFITGMMASSRKGDGLSSKVGTTGLFRKVYVILLIMSVYLVESAVTQTGGMIGDGVTLAYIVIELVSITENGGKLGAPIPKAVQNLIQVLKEKEEKEEK